MRKHGFDFDQLDGMPLTKQVEVLSDYIYELEEQFLTKRRPVKRFPKINFWPAEETIAVALVESSNRSVRSEQIIHLLYGGRAEGDQPRDPMLTIRQFIARIRKRLRPFNIELKTAHGYGWYMEKPDFDNFKAFYVAWDNEEENGSRSSAQLHDPQHRSVPGDGRGT
jgi:hypothetical protein